MKIHSVLFIANPHAGRFKSRGKPWIKTLQSDYHHRGIQTFTYFTECAGDVEGIRRAIQNAEPDVILSVGGDGTLNDVINAANDYNGIFAVIPAGSGNDAARMTWLRPDPPLDQFRDLNKLRQKRIDVWSCNGQSFVCGCGIGFEGAVVAAIGRANFKVPPKLKYWMMILLEVFRFKEIPFTAQLNNSSNITGKALMLSLANAPTVGGGIRISPNADPSDGALNVHEVRTMNALKRLINLPRIERGKHLNLPEVSSYTANQILITTSDQVYGHIDGQVIEGKEFSIHHSRQIQFLCT